MAIDALPNARIPELPPSAGPQSGFLLAMYNPLKNLTENVKVDFFTPGLTSQNFEWMSDMPYLDDEVVTRKGGWYQALSDVPENVEPGEDGGLYWQSINKSQSGFVFWQAGVFSETSVFVLYDVNQNPLDPNIQMFWLKDTTRPYVSVDIEAEILADDWEQLFVSATGGISLGDLFPDTYFVSPLGNDATAQPGDLGKPYTPAGALMAASSGDKITFLPGYYMIDYGMAKDGISYTTLGGDVIIEIFGTNTVLFDYSPSSSTLPIFITGYFFYKINGPGCAFFKGNDAAANYRPHFVTWLLMECWEGSYGIIFPRFSTAAQFDGQIDVDTAFTGFAMSTPLSSNFAESRGGKIDVRVNNMSAKPGFGGSSFKGYIVQINYYSNDVLAGFADGFSIVQDCLWTLNIVQNAGCTSKMPSGGTFNVNLTGGSYDFRGASKLQIDGFYKNANLLFNVTDGVYISGRLDTCYVFSNSDKLVISGESNDTELGGNSLVLYGLHIGMHFGVNSRVGWLKVFGTIIFKVGAFIAFDGNARMEVSSSGKIIGDYAGAFINMRTQPNNKLFVIGGQIINKSAGQPVIGFVDSGNVQTVILKSAVLVSNGGNTINVGATANAVLKIMGTSYMNNALGGAGAGAVVYPIDPVGSLIVNPDVEIMDF